MRLKAFCQNLPNSEMDETRQTRSRDRLDFVTALPLLHVNEAWRHDILVNTDQGCYNVPGFEGMNALPQSLVSTLCNIQSRAVRMSALG